MKSVKFLQQARQFADYLVQTSVEIPASLPQQDPYTRHASRDAQKKRLLDGQWDGHDRREHKERRASERRNERLTAMLDTRARVDRRRASRRQTDELESRSFSCRV